MEEALELPILKIIGQVADELNLKAWVVGGFVRDLMLRRENKDIDIVTVGSGVLFAEAVAKRLSEEHSLVVFRNF